MIINSSAEIIFSFGKMDHEPKKGAREEAFNIGKREPGIGDCERKNILET